jgi:hypothetical protein
MSQPKTRLPRYNSRAGGEASNPGSCAGCDRKSIQIEQRNIEVKRLGQKNEEVAACRDQIRKEKSEADEQINALQYRLTTLESEAGKVSILNAECEELRAELQQLSDLKIHLAREARAHEETLNALDVVEQQLEDIHARERLRSESEAQTSDAISSPSPRQSESEHSAPARESDTIGIQTDPDAMHAQQVRELEAERDIATTALAAVQTELSTIQSAHGAALQELEEMQQLHNEAEAQVHVQHKAQAHALATARATAAVATETETGAGPTLVTESVATETLVWNTPEKSRHASTPSSSSSSISSRNNTNTNPTNNPTSSSSSRKSLSSSQHELREEKAKRRRLEREVERLRESTSTSASTAEHMMRRNDACTISTSVSAPTSADLEAARSELKIMQRQLDNSAAVIREYRERERLAVAAAASAAAATVAGEDPNESASICSEYSNEQQQQWQQPSRTRTVVTANSSGSGSGNRCSLSGRSHNCSYGGGKSRRPFNAAQSFFNNSTNSYNQTLSSSAFSFCEDSEDSGAVENAFALSAKPMRVSVLEEDNSHDMDISQTEISAAAATTDRESWAVVQDTEAETEAETEELRLRLEESERTARELLGRVLEEQQQKLELAQTAAACRKEAERLEIQLTRVSLQKERAERRYELAETKALKACSATTAATTAAVTTAAHTDERRSKRVKRATVSVGDENHDTANLMR